MKKKWLYEFNNLWINNILIFNIIRNSDKIYNVNILWRSHSISIKIEFHHGVQWHKKHTNKLEELPLERNYSVWRWPMYASLLYYRLVRRDTWTP